MFEIKFSGVAVTDSEKVDGKSGKDKFRLKQICHRANGADSQNLSAFDFHFCCLLIKIVLIWLKYKTRNRVQKSQLRKNSLF